MRLPLPENSATEPSGFQITISACAFSHGHDFEDAVRADPVANVAEPAGGLGVERLTGFPPLDEQVAVTERVPLRESHPPPLPPAGRRRS